MRDGREIGRETAVGEVGGDDMLMMGVRLVGECGLRTWACDWGGDEATVKRSEVMTR